MDAMMRLFRRHRPAGTRVPRRCPKTILGEWLLLAFCVVHDCEPTREQDTRRPIRHGH